MKKLTKEEKRLKREQEKEELKKIKKLNKSSKVVITFTIVMLILMLINNVIMYFSEEYALFFINHIVNSLNGIIFYLSSYINYGSYFFILFFLVTLFILMIVESVIVSSKKSIEFKNKMYNRIEKVSFIYILIIFSYLIISCYYLHLPNLDNLIFESTKNKTYTKENLIELNEYLKNKVLEYGDKQNRIDGKVKFDGDINKQVIKDLHNIDDEITLLKGLYPARSSNLNNTLKGIVGSSTYGLTHFYSTYFDYNIDPVIIINTIAHEYTHTKGIVRENETVFISSLSGIKSDNIVSNYSGYLEAFSRVNYALYDIDEDISNDTEDEVVSKCLTNNYNELCNLYTKNNGDYINGSDKLYVSSYYLKNYIGHEKELEESLKLLTSDGGKLVIDEKEVTIEDIILSINENNNKHFNFQKEINKKSYDKIKESLKNDKLYKSIYQQNDVTEDSKYKENIEEYYLAPFKNYDSLFLNSKVSSIDYTYERSARLFLEYYDINGYK